MNRRSFVHFSLGALASPLLFPLSRTHAAVPSAPAPPPSAPSLGFSLYGMKSLPLEAAVQTCASLGYTHVELALMSGYPSAPDTFAPEARKALSAQLQSLRLGVPCLMLNLSLSADEAAHAKALPLIGDAAQLSRDLFPDQTPILETVLGGKPSTWDEQKKGMAEKLHAWSAAAEKARCIIALKAHVSSAVNSPERLLWLLDQVKSKSIAVAYDFSHFELQGIDLQESMNLLLPHTRFIHVKDSIGDTSNFQFRLPGEGRTDYNAYFAFLKQHHYAGPVCVEVSGQIFNRPGYDPIAAATKSFAVLSAALTKNFALPS